MECKKAFLLAQYDPMATIKVMSEQHDKHLVDQKKALKEMKDSGLTASEYIMGEEKKDVA